MIAVVMSHIPRPMTSWTLGKVPGCAAGHVVFIYTRDNSSTGSTGVGTRQFAQCRFPSTETVRIIRAPSTFTQLQQELWQGQDSSDDDDVELNVLGCRADILGTNCVHCSVLLHVHRHHKLIRTRSPGRPPRLSHSS